jgi:hypothetical protein
MAIRLNNDIRRKMVDVVSAYLSGTGGTAGSGGMLRIYNGTQPTNGGDTSGTCSMLVQINGLSWSAGTNGTAVITGTKTGTAGSAGTALWARLSGTDGTGFVVDGGCGPASTSDFVLDAVAIALSSVCSVTAATLVQPAS